MKREQILDCVFNEFATYGIKRVSVDEIAQKMRISKKTIYDLFRNKEELLRVAVEYRFGRMVEELAVMADQQPNVLYILVYNAVEGFRFCNAICPAFYEDLKGHPQTVEYFESVKALLQENARKRFLQGIRDGYIREDCDYKIIGRLLKSQVLSIMKDETEDKYTPAQVCFYSMITILGGACTDKGRAVLDEIAKKGI